MARPRATRFRMLVVAICVAVGVGVLTAAPAAAADGVQRVTRFSDGDPWYAGSSWCAQANNTKAIGCFVENGDLLGVLDNRSDGKSAGLRWFTSDGRKGLCINSHGKNDEENWSRTGAVGFWFCNKRFAAGIRITIRAGVCDGSTTNCRKAKNWNFGPRRRLPNPDVN